MVYTYTYTRKIVPSKFYSNKQFQPLTWLGFFINSSSHNRTHVSWRRQQTWRVGFWQVAQEACCWNNCHVMSHWVLCPRLSNCAPATPVFWLALLLLISEIISIILWKTEAEWSLAACHIFHRWSDSVFLTWWSNGMSLIITESGFDINALNIHSNNIKSNLKIERN